MRFLSAGADNEQMTALPEHQPLPYQLPGWRIKTLGDYHVDVVILSQSTRICLQHVDEPDKTWPRFWCYFGEHRTAAAVLAAMAMQTPYDEPAGWVKSSIGPL